MNEEIWKDDFLGRRDDADFVLQFLRGRLAENSDHGRGGGYVMNLNAPWGTGKTFFLQRLAAELREQGHLVAEVNAWRDDFSEDPFVAVLAAIEAAVAHLVPKPGIGTKIRAVQKNGRTLLKTMAKGAVLAVGKKAFEEGVEALQDVMDGATDGSPMIASVAAATAAAGEAAAAEFKKLTDRAADQAIENFRKAQATVEQFRIRMEELVRTYGQTDGATPLFVLVDELDRCRPSFAISMLERIKHLFQADGVVFLVATDTAQLEHAVKAVYGATFGANEYLNRFFDVSYRFDEPNLSPMVRDLLNRYQISTNRISYFDSGRQDLWKFLADYYTYFRVRAREATKCHDLLRAIVTLWNQPVPLQLHLLVPLIVGRVRSVTLSLEQQPMFEEIMRGRGQLVDTGYHPEIWSSNGSPKRLGVASAFSELSNIARSGDLKKALAKDVRDAYQDFCHDQVRGELTARNSPKQSLMASYPKLVEMAGRFTS